MNLLEVYGPAIAEYLGHGLLLYDLEVSIPIDFRCIQIHNANIYIHITFFENKGFSIMNRMDSIHGIRGTLSDGRFFESIGNILFLQMTTSSDDDSGHEGLLMLTQIEIKSIKLASTTKPSMLKFSLTNLKFLGTEFYQQKPNRLARRLPLEFDECKVTIYQEDKYKELVDEMESTKTCKVTSYLITPYNGNSLETNLKFVRHLCGLLSFAKGTEITWAYFQELDINGEIIKSIHRSGITSNFGNTEVIDNHEPDDLKYFLETVFETYLKREIDYELEKIIHALVQSKLDGSFLELRALIVSSAIDFLRGKWSKSHGREKIFGNRFKKHHKNIEHTLTTFANDYLKPKDKQIECMINKIPELNRPSLRDMLIEMAKDIDADISGEEINKFVTTRNFLVHEARFATEDKYLEFRGLLHLADLIILALLGYKGQYVDCRTWKRTKIN